MGHINTIHSKQQIIGIRKYLDLKVIQFLFSTVGITRYPKICFLQKLFRITSYTYMRNLVYLGRLFFELLPYKYSWNVLHIGASCYVGIIRMSDIAVYLNN